MSIATLDIVKTTVPDESEPKDEAPPVDGPKFVCQAPGCGVELHYGGRGRKPKFCDDHKKKSSGTTRTSVKASTADASVASRAAEIIISLTDVLGITCMLTGFHQTEREITEAQPEFREALERAFLTNPARARSVIRVLGGTSDLSLAIAFASFVTRIGSAAVAEYKEKNAEKSESPEV